VSFQHVEIIRLDLPANHKYLNILGACIAELLVRVDGIEEREVLTYNVQLAAHEACANIIDHAYAGELERRIEIMLTLAGPPRQLIIDLHDTGSAFDLSSVPAPDLDQAHDHGYGLFLIRSLMDEVTYTPRSGSNHWCMVKQL
jgi:serine/threonine-protein kinase RsbW